MLNKTLFYVSFFVIYYDNGKSYGLKLFKYTHFLRFVLQQILVYENKIIFSALAIEEKIFGGIRAGVIDFPYLVSIQYKIPKTKVISSTIHVCGGSILNQKWILTAAHCISEHEGLRNEYPGSELYVKAGVYNINGKGQFIKVKKYILHPKFDV